MTEQDDNLLLFCERGSLLMKVTLQGRGHSLQQLNQMCIEVISLLMSQFSILSLLWIGDDFSLIDFS